MIALTTLQNNDIEDDHDDWLVYPANMSMNMDSVSDIVRRDNDDDMINDEDDCSNDIQA